MHTTSRHVVAGIGNEAMKKHLTTPSMDALFGDYPLPLNRTCEAKFYALTESKSNEAECPSRVNNGSQPRPRKRLLSGAKRKSISGGWTSEISHKRTCPTTTVIRSSDQTDGLTV